MKQATPVASSIYVRWCVPGGARRDTLHDRFRAAISLELPPQNTPIGIDAI